MNKTNINIFAQEVITRLKNYKKKGIIRDIHKLSVKEGRKEFKKIRNFFSSQKSDEVLWAKDMVLNKVNVRYYRGKNNSVQDILPVMLFFHGGGWVLGDLDTHDQVCRKLVNDAKYDVLSIDYSLAPESVFPKAVEECAGILKSLGQKKNNLKIDSSKIIVCGDSAGGNIAAVLCHYNKLYIHAKILLQILIYPATSLFSNYKSKQKYNGLILSHEIMSWFEKHYVPDNIKGIYINDWRLSPLKAKSFNNLPDSFIALAECDPLYDEGLLYAQKLIKSGNTVDLNIYNGQIHGFLTMGGVIPDTNKMINQIKVKTNEYL